MDRHHLSQKPCDQIYPSSSLRHALLKNEARDWRGIGVQVDEMIELRFCSDEFCTEH